jgi:hypothetical protein
MHYSEYFRKALSGTWTEAKDGVVKLANVEPAVFNLFVEWLYVQRIPCAYNGYVLITGANNGTQEMWMIMLYVFAYRFGVSALRTTMNRKIVGDSDSWYPKPWENAAIIYAFDNLPPTNPLLDHLVDRYFMAWAGGSDTGSVLPPDFLRRFFERVGNERARRGNNDAGVYNMDACSYHEHTTDADKASCRYKSKTLDDRTLLGRLDENGSRTSVG